METSGSSPEKQALISSFLEIAVGQSAGTAAQFLQATGWQLEEAIHLFYAGGEGSVPSNAGVGDPPAAGEGGVEEAKAEEEVRPPLPVVREVLYDDFYGLHKGLDVAAFHHSAEKPKRSDIWEAGQSTASTSQNSHDNLASLYRPPFALIYNGSFEKAKVEASLQGKWLLVNLQSTEEFASHMLNRDTWSKEAVVDIIQIKFIFWQVYCDTTEGRKVCTYYNVASFPAILLINPITGQKIRSWSGMVHPEQLLEDLLSYLDEGPREHIVVRHNSLAGSVQTPSNSFPDKALQEDEDREMGLAILASLEASKADVGAVEGQESKTGRAAVINTIKKPLYLPLPEEPKVERSLMCRVGIRLPDGTRLQRNFLRADSIKLLWSFCSSKADGGETQPFHFSLAIPGATKLIKYEDELTFEEAGLSNSMILLVWE